MENRRIVYSYAMYIDDRRISVSLATLEFQLVGSDTLLILTEQGAYHDGLDQPTSREHGMKDVLDALETELARGSASA